MDLITDKRLKWHKTEVIVLWLIIVGLRKSVHYAMITICLMNYP